VGRRMKMRHVQCVLMWSCCPLLGCPAVELLPVFEYDELEFQRR
jgi:hypothetical protein